MTLLRQIEVSMVQGNHAFLHKNSLFHRLGNFALSSMNHWVNGEL